MLVVEVYSCGEVGLLPSLRLRCHSINSNKIIEREGNSWVVSCGREGNKLKGVEKGGA